MLQKIMADPKGVLAAGLALLIAFNVIMGGVKKVLDVIDPTDEQKAASKPYQIVSKIISGAQFVIDLIQGNLAH